MMMRSKHEHPSSTIGVKSWNQPATDDCFISQMKDSRERRASAQLTMIHIWICRWPVDERVTLLNDIQNITNYSGLSFVRPSRTYTTQSSHMCITPTLYESIFYEAEFQCRSSRHRRPHGVMTCPLCRFPPPSPSSPPPRQRLLGLKQSGKCRIHQRSTKPNPGTTRRRQTQTQPAHCPHHPTSPTSRTETVPDHESHPQ
jgi:hypothetical protein